MPHWPLRLPPARAGMPDVATFGENSLDFAGAGPRPSAGSDKTSLSSFAQFAGGQAATVAVGCARQGWRARYVGSFGDDNFATTIQATLIAESVEVVPLVRRAVGNRVAIILVDEASGDRSVFEFRPPELRVEARDVPMGVLVAARVLMVDATHAEASVAIAMAARAAGIPVVVDIDRRVPQAAELLSHVDVVVVPEAFALAWTGLAEPGRALAALHDEFHAPVTIITMGGRGTLALTGRDEMHVPAFAVEAVDTTGAGDAFRAGLVSGWLAHGDRADAEAVLAHANATAALNCRAFGAQTGLPGRAAVETLVTERRDGQSK